MRNKLSLQPYLVHILHNELVQLLERIRGLKIGRLFALLPDLLWSISPSDIPILTWIPID